MRSRSACLSVLLLALSAAPAFARATITILNADGPNEGFNDPTPAAPVGGNPGTTIGAQRLIAFQFAADIWGAALDSNVRIVIQANFDPLFCDDVSAVLGSAGTAYLVSDFGGLPTFPGSEFADIWYHGALADKRAGAELNPGVPDITAQFNSNLGKTGCLTGFGFYPGLDNNHGARPDLVVTLLHEFGHGLGFSQFASLATGVETGNQSDVFARNLLDRTLGRTWDQMTDTQRRNSAINYSRVVWQGSEATNSAASLLLRGAATLRVNSPSSVAGRYPIGEALFGAPLSTTPVTGTLVAATDASNSSGTSILDACTALTNAGAVNGRIALIDRGTCNFSLKVKNAQNAGAIGVVIADNVSGAPPADMPGVDGTIVIPSVRVIRSDGVALRAALGSGVNVSMLIDNALRKGTDEFDHVRVFAPDPVVNGSSISHFDTVAAPNLLMEPILSGDLTHGVEVTDLTLAAMRDVGWFPDADVDGQENAIDPDDDNDGVTDGSDCAPLQAGSFALPREVTGETFAADKVTLRWNSAAPGAGNATVHDVLRGALGSFPVGAGASEVCLASGVVGTETTDLARPALGKGTWYLVRGRNDCGDGTYGEAATGTRVSSVCP
jgi:hypothetical protein